MSVWTPDTGASVCLGAPPPPSWWRSRGEGASRPHLSWCLMPWVTSENECPLQSLLPGARPSPEPCPLFASSEERLVFTQQPHTEDSMILKSCPGLRARKLCLGGTDPASLDSQTSGRSHQPSIPSHSGPRHTCTDVPTLEPGTPPHGPSVLCTLRSCLYPTQLTSPPPV